jgi:hypothetical protein
MGFAVIGRARLSAPDPLGLSESLADPAGKSGECDRDHDPEHGPPADNERQHVIGYGGVG